MAIAVTLQALIGDDKTIRAIGTIVFSGNYATGGEAFDFLAGPYTAGTGKLSTNRVGYTNKPVSNVIINGMSGFIYQYDRTNKKILVFTNTAGAANAPLGEHTAAAYVAGVLADIITFEAVFLKM